MVPVSCVTLVRQSVFMYLLMYLLIYGLFYDAVTISDCIASNYRYY
jgi:hypothetical protein